MNIQNGWQLLAHCKLIIANCTGPIENHEIWFCCSQAIKVQTRLDRRVRASKQSDQRICYSISKTLIAKLAMRIIQIET